jgi:glyoxylase-like metal-dependent hydrolase (beta-lactamase superfamily II)
VLVAPRVHRLVAPNPSLMTGPGTNTYLIGERAVAVVDAGPDLPEHVAAILAAVAESGGQVAALLVTHGHSDHLPATYHLKERTGAPIWGHPSIGVADHPLRDGEAVEVGDLRLVAFETPGHAADHLCFWLDAERLLFSGDLVAGQGTVVLSRAPGSLTHYLASLNRMRDLGPQTILPGHGPIVADGQAKLQEYLDHRAMRSRQILEVLKAGPASVDTIVERLYVGTPSDLRPMAARNVLTHLEHLESRGSVASAGSIWALRPPEG